jgi:hypothetical protein
MLTTWKQFRENFEFNPNRRFNSATQKWTDEEPRPGTAPSASPSNEYDAVSDFINTSFGQILTEYGDDVVESVNLVKSGHFKIRTKSHRTFDLNLT